MLHLSKSQKLALDIFQVVLGNALSAFAVACFALPYNMVVSGLAGVGRMVNHYTGFSISGTVYILNITLFVIGALILGKKFAASIVIGTFTYPFFLSLFQQAAALQHLVEDPLLAAVCAGIIDGVGMGLVLRTGGSTGGIDVPPLILHRKLGWKVAPVMYAIDVCIFLIQLPITATNGVILGILYALLYTMVMNKILIMDQGGVQIMVFSKKSDEINEKLLQMGYGTTILQSVSGYLREAMDVVYCVAASRSLNRIKRAALAIDDKAFITISNVSEVNGNGFTVRFGDEPYEPNLEDRREGLQTM
ncbi:MAG: YitT family protein [Mogibacterium sp.]|nr:YitT family protein [Mogibacterium sp.]